jgi:hypothetical protein
MSGHDYLSYIKKALSQGERPEDIVTMIDIVADTRAEARDTSPERESGPAAKILCILFDPLKPPTYREDIVRVRRQFVGIADDNEMQDRFRSSQTAVVRFSELAEIFSMPVSALFEVAEPMGA